MELIYFGITDIGKKYKNNEDFFLLPEPNEKYEILNMDVKNKGELFILCDGIGGGNAGEVASELCANWFYKEFYGSKENFPLDLIIENINKKLYDLSLKYEKYKGMGTTFVGGVFIKEKLFFCSVGDSRLYLFRDKEFIQLSEDHSNVWNLYKMGEIKKEEILTHPRKNIINSAVGINKTIKKINKGEKELKNGDLLLFCSDGLSDMLKDNEINCELLKNKSLQKTAENLVIKANKKGGNDNITLILVQVKESR